MTSFETEIRKRIRLQIIKAIGIGIFVITVLIIKSILQGGVGAVNDSEWIILIGMLCGGGLSSFRAIRYYQKALSSQEALEQLQIEESDERNRSIVLIACRRTVLITCIFLSCAGILASFFSRTIFFTLIIVLIGILGLYSLLLVYYKRRY